MKRLYLDSNVFISLAKREMDFNFRGLFIEAEQFFEKAKENKDILILSSHTIKEIRAKILWTNEEIIALLQKGNLVELIKIQETDYEKALFISKKGIHFEDAMHVALAIKAKCDCIITFNKKDFEVTQDLIPAEEPLLFS